MSATARTFTLYLYSEDCLHHDLEEENVYSGHTERLCGKAKKVTVPKVCSTVQSLLRDISWCCRKGKSAVDALDVLQCSKPVYTTHNAC